MAEAARKRHLPFARHRVRGSYLSLTHVVGSIRTPPIGQRGEGRSRRQGGSGAETGAQKQTAGEDGQQSQPARQTRSDRQVCRQQDRGRIEPVKMWCGHQIPPSDCRPDRLQDLVRRPGQLVFRTTYAKDGPVDALLV